MKLFAKGKGSTGPAEPAPSFQPIDRGGLLGLLDQVVNGGQSGVLELHEPRGTWTYAFQGGALTHASGGRVRGARQAFDLLWEFQSGEFQFTAGTSPGLAGNLYIDKNRLQDLLRRSQAVLQSPASPYIPLGQERPIQPVPRPYSPPVPGQFQTWQPGQPGQGQPQPAWPQQGQPQQPPPAWPPQGQPGQPQSQPGQPTWGNGGYPPPPPGYQQPFPQAPYGQGPGTPPQIYPQPYPTAPQPPVFAGPYPAQPMTPAPPAPAQAAPAPVAPAPGPAPAPAPARPATPPSFSVPPMPIPKRKEAVPVYQPPVAPASAISPLPEVVKPAAPSAPKDDLQSLRASLVAQSPAAPPAPSAPAWGVRSAEGVVTPAPDQGKGKAKGGARGQKGLVPGQKKAKSKLRAALDVRLITFLLWACERKYSPEDHWTLKDAFEVSTMELRDQFIGAFSESFKSGPKKTINDDDVDQMAAGRMRGRAKKR
ncbi:MAG: DUF4388 domain-containing protein [Candidatus Dormibacteraeota bacterium]|nr:DUF4388 domain-containing protein [Candidatus Dormibacteraeota bacterium]